MYMEIAKVFARQSHAVRKRVGAVIVKDNNILSYGWNGTPAGDDNVCEHLVDGKYVTKPETLHSESNALMKLVKSGSSVGTAGAYLYVTLSPCLECAKLIKQAGITRVVYGEEYRDVSGIKFLENRNVDIKKFDGN